MKEVEIEGGRIKVSSSVDATGLFCPLPVVKLKLALENLNPKEVVELLADDPGVLEDVPAWCKETGHKLLGITKDEAGTISVYVEKRKRQDEENKF